MINRLLIQESQKGIERGWAYTPLNGKRPFLKSWATKTVGLDELEQHVKRGHNLGVLTGKRSGLIVIDIDTEKGGLVPEGLPETVTVRTGGGGRHKYFRLPPGATIGNSAGRLGPHVDVRGNGGQVVAVGSIHPDTGMQYTYATGFSPDDVQVATLPAHILRLLRNGKPEHAAPQPTRPQPTRPHSHNAQDALDHETRLVASTEVGQRNNNLNRAAFNLGHLVPHALDEDLVRRRLSDTARECGLPEGEAQAAITSGIRAGKKEPREIAKHIGNGRSLDWDSVIAGSDDYVRSRSNAQQGD